MRRVGAALLSLAAVGQPRVVGAEAPAAPALSWMRAAGAERCIAGPELAERVEAQLGREVLVALPQAQLSVEGSVAAEAQGYRVYLRLADRDGRARGERALAVASSDCRALDPLLVFLIALMLDPDAPLLPPRLPDGLGPDTRQALADLFGAEPSVPPLELAQPAAHAVPTVALLALACGEDVDLNRDVAEGAFISGNVKPDQSCVFSPDGAQTQSGLFDIAPGGAGDLTSRCNQPYALYLRVDSQLGELALFSRPTSACFPWTTNRSSSTAAATCCPTPSSSRWRGAWTARPARASCR